MKDNKDWFTIITDIAQWHSAHSSTITMNYSHIILCITVNCVQKKNTHSHFLSYLHEWCVDLNRNCREYTQRKVDSDERGRNYIFNSLRPMRSLLRHIFLAKVGASLQHAISRESRISFFWRVQGTCWCILNFYIVRIYRSLGIFSAILQFLFKSTYHSWGYERKREWVFFFLNTVYKYTNANIKLV